MCVQNMIVFLLMMYKKFEPRFQVMWKSVAKEILDWKSPYHWQALCPDGLGVL